MNISDAGLELIKEFENCKLDAYLDIRGIPTIGWGSTGPDIQLGLTWTQDQADADLASKTNALSSKIYSSIPNDPQASFSQEDATQGQIDALTSFSYNLGLHALQTSTLWKDYLAGNIQQAADQFLLWDHAGSEVVAGLLRRRQAERALFLS